MSTELAALGDRLHRARRVLDRQVGEARAVAAAGKRTTAEVADLRTKVELHERAAHLLTGIGEQRQAAIQTQIETLVTQGLRTIFGDDMSFHLVGAVRAKTPVVDFVVRSTADGHTVDTDVMDARGGGLAAVVGILLRVVRLLLASSAGPPSAAPGSPSRSTILGMDETAAHLSPEYEPRLAEFLRQIVDKTGIQIVLVTHSDAYTDHADVRYRFEVRDGVTVVKSV